MPLPYVRSGKAKQCTARSKRSGERCRGIAAYGLSTCRMHGSRKKETIRSGEDHPHYRHGQSTKEAKSAYIEEREVLRFLQSLLLKLDNH